MLKEFELVSEFDGLMLSCAIYEAEEVFLCPNFGRDVPAKRWTAA